MDDEEKIIRQRELKRRQEVNDLLAVLSLVEGRRLLYRLIVCSGALNQTTMTADALMTAFAEGKRWLGNEILIDILEEQPQLLKQMKQEYEREE